MLENPGIYGPRKDRLVGYWSMDGSYISGSTIIDSTTANNNGTMSAGVSQGIGYIGGSLVFDGSGGVTLPNLGLSGDTPVSISAWVNVDSGAPSYNDIIGWGDVNTDLSVFHLRTAGDGAFRIVWYGDGMTATCPNYYGQGWVHVVAVWDPVGDARRIWVDSVQENSDTPPNHPSFIDANYNIGNFEGNGFQGRIDEVRVYDYPLFGSQIDELYNQPQ